MAPSSLKRYEPARISTEKIDTIYHSQYSLEPKRVHFEKKFDLTSLAVRRKLARLSFFHSLYHNNLSFAHTNIHPAHHVPGHSYHAFNVQPIFARTNQYQNSPLVLSIKEWNTLPPEIVTLTGSSAFQLALLTLLTRDSVE